MTDASADTRGALRFIDPAAVVAAAGLVREGIVVPLNLPLTTHHPKRPAPELRFLEREALRPLAGGGFALVNDDAIDMAMQGSSHWDALGHFGVLSATGNEVYYGGRGLGDVAPLTIDAFARGIVTRGVVVDLVSVLAPGARWLPTDLRVDGDSLRHCLDELGIELRRGDVVMLYTGFEDLVAHHGGVFPDACAGVDASTVPLWRDAEIAGLAADNIGVEALPADFGLHIAMLPELGIPLGELWALREVVSTGRDLGRWEFLFVSVPLNMPGAFGSPANAVAVF
jgi:kynurenine formamidase